MTQLVAVRVFRIHREADKLWRGLITAECSCKNQMPVLFDSTVTRWRVALRNRMEALENISTFEIETEFFKTGSFTWYSFLTYTFYFYCSQEFPVRGCYKNSSVSIINNMSLSIPCFEG